MNKNIEPVFLASLFYLGAAIFLIPFSYKNFRKEYAYLKTNKKDIWRLAGAIVFGGICGPILLLFGIKMIDASSASLFLNFETVATSLLAYILFKEHIGKNVLLSSILTVVAGVVLLSNFNLRINWGGILIISGCFCWGFDNNFTATVEGISPKTNTVIKGLFAGIFNLILAVILFNINISFISIILALMIGFLSYGLSIVLYILAARNLGAARSQIIFAINPFIGSIFSFILLQDNFEPKYLLALSIMICAFLLLYYEKHQHLHDHDSREHTHEHNHDDGHHEHSHKEDNNKLKHSHQHKHDRTSHFHPHYPDIHHRHKHYIVDP